MDMLIIEGMVNDAAHFGNPEKEKVKCGQCERLRLIDALRPRKIGEIVHVKGREK